MNERGIAFMRLNFQSSYNFEILSFLNILTSDDFYVHYNKDSYDKFYPLLSSSAKEKINLLVTGMQRTNIAFLFNVLLANIPGHDNNSVADSYAKNDIVDEIVSYMKQLPYIPSDVFLSIEVFLNACVGIVSELETLGFNEYWRLQIKPSVELKCKEYQEFIGAYDFGNLFTQYKPLPSDEMQIYICRFHRPHGTKLSLSGNAMILSDNFSKESLLMLVTHEMFHSPYDSMKASESLKILSGKPWVMEAFNNQNENCRYAQMDYFIEENIVEALGVYIAYSLGIEKKPYEYFKEHDYGSHVISPMFFRYMLEHPKSHEEEFEKYLYDFSCELE